MPYSGASKSAAMPKLLKKKKNKVAEVFHCKSGDDFHRHSKPHLLGARNKVSQRKQMSNEIFIKTAPQKC